MSLQHSELQQIIEWDVHNWGKCLPYWQAQSGLDWASSKALEIGSRNGGLSLWLAQNGASVICSDLQGPSDLAREKHIRNAVHNRIEYANINALNLPFDNELDAIAFKSVLGGLEEHGGANAHLRAIEQIHRSLRTDGELLFAENLLASPLHQMLRRHAVSWAREWHYPSLDEFLGWLSPFSAVRWQTAGFLGVLGRTENQRRALARVDSILLEHCVPQHWHYIVYGVAVK